MPPVMIFIIVLDIIAVFVIMYLGSRGEPEHPSVDESSAIANMLAELDANQAHWAQVITEDAEPQTES